MSNRDKQESTPLPANYLPWYRQFWPWFIIALPASAVVASFITLWLAISNPDPLVVNDDEYQQIKSELKAQAPERDSQEDEPEKPEPRPD
jgi:hypothetical protein